MSAEAEIAGNRSKLTRLLIAGLFTGSGACALVYQVAWVRMFALEFGSTALAVSSVVAVFMGGLAWGAVWGGRLGLRSGRPLTRYGWVETGLASYAAMSPWWFDFALRGLSAGAIGMSESFAWLAVVRLVAAALLILPPTILMGATLPLLAAWVEKSCGDLPVHRVGTLYAVNTMGAMAGALIAGLLLLPTLGMKGSVLLAAGINLGIGLTCVWLGGQSNVKSAMSRGLDLGMTPNAKPVVKLGGKRSTFTPSMVVALAGAAALACQVLWTRVASMMLGASVYSFSMVLATFLAGLGLGAAAVNHWLAWRPHRAGRLLWVLLLASAVAIVASSAILPFLPQMVVQNYLRLGVGADGTRALLLQLSVASALLLPATFLMGGIFPTVLAAMRSPGRALSGEVGRLYAINTIGCILGSLAGGFVLLPLLGLRNGLLAAAGMMLAAAAMVDWHGQSAKVQRINLVLIVMIAAGAVVLTPSLPPLLATSGPQVNMPRHVTIDSDGSGIRPGSFDSMAKLLYYGDGLVATVTVTEDVEADGTTGNRLLIIDGKPDGSDFGDLPTQRLSAHLPMLLHPGPQDVCVIGMGTGCTAGSAALHPGVRVRVVEIERHMVEAARWFSHVNHRVHDLDNVEIAVSDGRLHLLNRRRAYDVVISEPSSVWTSGSSNLFTTDYFRRASGALKEGGIFAQWVPLYGLTPHDIQILVSGFQDAFPEVLVASTIVGADLLLLGSGRSFHLDTDAIARRMEDEAIANDLRERPVSVYDVHDLLSRIRLTTGDVAAMTQGIRERHTDDRPILAYRAARNMHLPTRDANEALLARYAGGVLPLFKLPLSPPEDDPRLWNSLWMLASAYETYLPGGREAAAIREWLGGGGQGIRLGDF